MAYANGNPYRESITDVRHDGCVPRDHLYAQVDGVERRVGPWHWTPRWGRLVPCGACDKPVA